MTTVTVTTTGAGSFTIPAGVSSITFEAWGGGAGGRTDNGTSQEGGGGGGAYINVTYAVAEDDVIFFDVGAGVSSDTAGNASWFNKNTNSPVSANGAYIAGGGGQFSPGGGAISASGGETGTVNVSRSGGSGANPQGGGGSRRGSGGGGASGFDGVGGTGTAGSGNTSGGVGGTGDGGSGGAGGAGGSPGGTGTSNVEGGGGGGGGSSGQSGGDGGAPGGGGGGGGSSSGASGTGARGQIRYTYTVDIAGGPVGRADETDLSQKAGGIALASQRADTTNTALALVARHLIPTGLASTTNTANPSDGLGPELVINGDMSSATGWTIGTSYSISGGKLNTGTTQITSPDTNQQVLTSGAPRDAIYRVIIDIDTAPTGAGAHLLLGTFHSRGNMLTYSLRDNGTGTKTIFSKPNPKFVGNDDLWISFSNLGLTGGTNGVLDNLSVRQYGPPVLAPGVGRADEADTAFALSNPIVPIGRSDETDTALALTAVQIRAAGRADETDLALQRNLAHGVGRANESSLALPRGIVLATGRANETDSSLARGLGQPTGRAAEVDTALALAQGAGLVVGRADEADTAFNLPPIFNTGRSDETDAAFARAPLLARGTGRADETDATFALSRLFIRATGQGNETDLAVQRVATVLAATGLAGEIDVAETLFPPLIAGEGYIKEVRLKWLDDRIQRVYRKRTVEEA